MALIATLPALAQSNGMIAGQVTDLTKAAAPGARVVVTAVETGIAHPTQDGLRGLLHSAVAGAH